MITCQKCKLILEPDTVCCPRCGRKLTNGTRRVYTPPDPHTQSLLLEARTMKDKGGWEQAIDKCMDALKREPECPDVYVALGEVYEAQGGIDQALQWYQMADSEFAALGKPILELQERIRNLNSRRASGHLTTGWFDRFVGGSRFSSSMRVITTAMVGFIVLLILGAIFVIYADKMRDEKMSAPRVTVHSSAGRTASSPSVVTSTSGGRRTTQPGVTQSQDSPERKFLTAVMDDPVVSQRQITVSDVVIDPRHKQIIVQFKVSHASGALSKSVIMADSAAVCTASYKASADAVYVTVCALADIPDRTGGYGLTRVFVADTHRQTAAGINPSLPPSEMEKLFMNPWWDPQITM